MRRKWVMVALVAAAAMATAAGYRGLYWGEFRYLKTRLTADLARPDALIRTASLARLPRDLLRVPVARDVLTEDLVFYYEQHEDRLGLQGAIRRIAYEHQLAWSDRLLANALDAPAEIAFWRDGKGALRHFAIVMRRNALARVLQEAATVALKDRQLRLAGEIPTRHGKATVYALEINPRRTFLLVAKGDRLVVLSDPGLLFDRGNEVVASARLAVAEWLDTEGALSRRYALDDGAAPGAARATHTLAVGAPALTLGYAPFLSGFKGVRFDFGDDWSTKVWIDPEGLPPGGLGDAQLWHAAPANPSACILLPVDWRAAGKVVSDAKSKPRVPDLHVLTALDGDALACWYRESTLYAPVFIARLARELPQRDAALQALATWALAQGGPGAQRKALVAQHNAQDDVAMWRAPLQKTDKGPVKARATLAAHAEYIVFSPDGALVERVLDTMARKLPSVADQMPTGAGTLALLTPNPLSAMAQHEAIAALSGPGDANLRAAALKHLPPRMKALATYPPYRLELANSPGKMAAGWQPVEWRTPEAK